MNKKGISPLIGTVLLVAITIAMILLIMPWITRTIKTQQERSTEALTQMDCVDKLDFDLLVGSTDNKITVDNTGQADIWQLTFRTYDATGKLISTVKDPATMAATAKVAKYTTVLSAVICDPTSVDKVEAIAVIKSGDNVITCSDSPREVYC